MMLSDHQKLNLLLTEGQITTLEFRVLLLSFRDLDFKDFNTSDTDLIDVSNALGIDMDVIKRTVLSLIDKGYIWTMAGNYELKKNQLLFCTVKAARLHIDWNEDYAEYFIA